MDFLFDQHVQYASTINVHVNEEDPLGELEASELE